MHSRNIYKSGLDFKKLLADNPNLQPFCNVTLSGSVEYSFKTPESLSELTRILLKEDFDLDVEVPPSKLVPTLPLRLNYILWIEDLVQILIGVNSNLVSGVDVGTGASCVFSLLGARKSWKMLATEINLSSVDIAKKNIERNNLGHLITLKHVENSSLILKGVIDEDKVYHFSICNPPFFDINEKPQRRTAHRHPPNNAPTGSAEELSTDGGELQFITKMIQDSKELQNNILIFTTMLGKQRSLQKCYEKLKQCQVKSFVVNEFRQGRTTRWGLAWSYRYDLPPTGFRDKETNKCQPIQLQVAKDISVEDTFYRLQILLAELDMNVDINEGRIHTLHATARQRTWVHRRKLLRQMQREGKKQINELDEPCNKKLKLQSDASENAVDSEKVDMPIILEIDAEVTEKNSHVTVTLTLGGIGNRNLVYEVLQFLKNNFSASSSI